MSRVRVIQMSWVSLDGANVLLYAGEEYDARHKLVRAYPNLFVAVPEPEPEKRTPTRRSRNA